MSTIKRIFSALLASGQGSNDSGDSVDNIGIDNYLTIEALEDGLTVSLSDNDLEYCIDLSGNWQTLSAGTASPSLNTGQYISFRANITPVQASDGGCGTFTISKKCNLHGNCMSILFGDSASGKNLNSNTKYAFCDLFLGCSKIITVSENFLPSKVAQTYCYKGMFKQCTALTNVPKLPATSLSGTYCYSSMFSSCKSLVNIPYDLLMAATGTASYGCFQYMFENCTKLQNACKIGFKKSGNSSCQRMYTGCTVLSDVPSDMFNTSITLESNCFRYMFYNCKALTKAPILNAATLKSQCYLQMFYGCSALSEITMLATDISASSCLSNWVSGVASSGILYKNSSMTTLPSGASGIPSGWTVQNAYE